MRFFLDLAYRGTAYCGWQRQPNGLAVQEVVESALQMLLRTPTPVVGAGRTDAGVHARQMVAHFDAEPTLAPDGLVRRLNGLLPPDIAVRAIRPVAADAHARFDAVSRRYEYWLTLRKDPFRKGLITPVYGQLDFDRMNQAAAWLLEYTDFTSFSKLHTDVKTNNCTVTRARWEPRGDATWCFSIEANRFLRNMVRAIVGTLLEVGRGRLSVEDFRRIIERRDRSLAGSSAPADGLYLVEVRYPY